MSRGKTAFVLWIVASVLVVPALSSVALASPPAGPGGNPMPPQPAPGAPAGTPTPPPVNTPPGAPPGGNLSGNNSGGGLGSGLANGFLDALGPIGDFIRDPGNTTANATEQLAQGVLLASAYVPAPNNMGNWYRAPTNGMWPDRWDVHTDKARPLFWAVAGITLLLNLAGHSTGVFQSRKGWVREWLFNFSAGYLAWQIAGAWLNIRRGLTYWLLQDVTAGGLETSLTAALVLVAFVVLAFVNIWILAVLLLIVGMVYGGIAFLTPWLGVLIMLRAFPLKIVAGVGDQMAKLWFVLTFLTLPIAAFVGAGFTLDVASTFNPNAIALNNPSRAVTTTAKTLLSLAVKFGSILGGILSAYWVFSGLQSVGMATGVVGAPSPEQLQQRYQRGREKAGEVRERSRTAANAPREVARGAQGRAPVDPDTAPSRSYDAGRAVGDYISAAKPNRARSGAEPDAATDTPTDTSTEWMAGDYIWDEGDGRRRDRRASPRDRSGEGE